MLLSTSGWRPCRSAPIARSASADVDGRLYKLVSEGLTATALASAFTRPCGIIWSHQRTRDARCHQNGHAPTRLRSGLDGPLRLAARCARDAAGLVVVAEPVCSCTVRSRPHTMRLSCSRSSRSLGAKRKLNGRVSARARTLGPPLYIRTTVSCNPLLSHPKRDATPARPTRVSPTQNGCTPCVASPGSHVHRRAALPARTQRELAEP